MSKVLQSFVIGGIEFHLIDIWIFPSFLVIFTALLFLLAFLKRLSIKEAILIFAWLLDVFFSHFLSKHTISEYYFNNLMIVSLVVFSILLTYLLKKSRIIFGIIAAIFLIINFHALFTKPALVGEYLDKKTASIYVINHAKENGYHCIALNFIGSPGVGYGYRYLFWLYGAKVITPGNDVPVYNLVIPAEISGNEVVKTFGDIGIILPKNPKINAAACNNPSRQSINLNGFVN